MRVFQGQWGCLRIPIPPVKRRSTVTLFPAGAGMSMSFIRTCQSVLCETLVAACYLREEVQFTLAQVNKYTAQVSIIFSNLLCFMRFLIGFQNLWTPALIYFFLEISFLESISTFSSPFWLCWVLLRDSECYTTLREACTPEIEDLSSTWQNCDWISNLCHNVLILTC